MAAVPALRVSGVTKRFGAVIANDAVSIEIWPGEVHCLLGENGAGKSTLITMLAGLQQPDLGTIELAGRPAGFHSPAAAISRGVAVVHQHSTLIPTMTVLENLMLAQTHGLWLQPVPARARLAELGQLLGAQINPDALVSELSLGQRQQLEIAKALWAAPHVLVLDEPTSMLSAPAIAKLLASVRRLTAHGVAVLLVTHKLAEAVALGDRVTVLREGRVVQRFVGSELRALGEDQSSALILAAMFGDAAAAHDEVAPPEPCGIDAVVGAEQPEVLRLDSVSTASGGVGAPLERVTLAVRAGEVVGVAGIDGHGQRHLAEVIAGQRPARTGRVLFRGAELTGVSVRARQRLGVRYLTDDRLHEGIVGSFSVALNLLLKRLGEAPFWHFGRMRRSMVAAHAAQVIAQYGVRTASAHAPAGTLSGGNIQKLLLARELADGAELLVCHKPSYGLDLKTVRRVHAEIRRFAAGGGAVLLLSTDLDELAALAHRVVVLSGGRIRGEVRNDGPHTRERLGELISGQVRA